MSTTHFPLDSFELGRLAGLTGVSLPPDANEEARRGHVNGRFEKSVRAEHPPEESESPVEHCDD